MTNRSQLAGSSTRSRELFDWVSEMAWFTKADRIVWCDGSEQERERLTELAVATGVLIPLNQNKRPDCYLSIESQRRRAVRGSHLHLHAQQGRGRPDEQLDASKRPFCGYNMGDYFAHWLAIGAEQPPRIFMVNWCRKGRDGSFLWPGYSENMRVLKWIVDRARGRVAADETPIGFMPRAADLNLSGLDMSTERLELAMAIRPEEWLPELDLHEQFFAGIGETLPPQLDVQREALRAGLEQNWPTERSSSVKA
jgi:GTP-dependent phosphoenolpyruvate carboxykinase